MPFFSISTTAWALIGAALLFNTLFSALFYSISYIINSSTQLAMAKENVTQLIFTGFIIVIFLSAESIMSVIMSGIVCFDAPTGACSSINHAQAAFYSLEILENTLINLYSKLYLFEMVIAILSSISMALGVIRIFLFIVSVHIVPFIGLALIANVQVTIVESIGYVLALTIAKQTVLDMAIISMPTIFLPMGLFFRAIPWLRSTGSTIIAIAFTMYFIFPLALIFTNFVIFDLYQQSPTYIHFDDPSPVAQLCADPESVNVEELTEHFRQGEIAVDNAIDGEYGILSDVWNIITKIGAAIAGAAKLVWDLIAIIFRGDFNLLDVFVLPIFIKSYYYYSVLELSVAAQFLVSVLTGIILEFIIIVTAHRSISAVIGGETELFGLSKIV